MSSTSLKISHLQKIGVKPDSGYGEARSVKFPDALQYGIVLDQRDDIDSTKPSNCVAKVPNMTQAEEDHPSITTPSTIVESEHAQQSTQRVEESKDNGQAMITPMPTSDLPASAVATQTVGQAVPIEDTVAIVKSKQAQLSQLSEGFNTQSSNIPEMKYALKAMMQPEHITQGDTQTQWFPPPSRKESNNVPDFGDESPSTVTERLSLVKGNKPALSQSVAKNLESVRSDLRKNALKLANQGGSKKKPSDVILCQCGCSKEEGDMVSCSDRLSKVGLTADRPGQLRILWYVAASALLWLHQCS